MIYLDVLIFFLGSENPLASIDCYRNVFEKYAGELTSATHLSDYIPLLNKNDDPLIFQHTCIWFSYFQFNLFHKVQLLHHPSHHSI